MTGAEFLDVFAGRLRDDDVDAFLTYHPPAGEPERLRAENARLRWALAVLIMAVIGKAQPPPRDGVTARWLIYMAGVAARKAQRWPNRIRMAVEGVRAAEGVRRG